VPSLQGVVRHETTPTTPTSPTTSTTLATLRLACQVEVRDDLYVHTRAGGPVTRPSLETGAPAWKNALSNKKTEP